MESYLLAFQCNKKWTERFPDVVSCSMVQLVMIILLNGTDGSQGYKGYGVAKIVDLVLGGDADSRPQTLDQALNMLDEKVDGEGGVDTVDEQENVDTEEESDEFESSESDVDDA
jgi:hypothetical protein